MSHELTVFEWVNRLTNEFNELRIAASDVIKMKAVEFFSDASVFIVNHSSELLYGSLSVFMVVIFTLLLNRALNAENKVHELVQLLDSTNFDLLIAESQRDAWESNWELANAEGDRLLVEVNELSGEIEDSKLAFAAMRDEFSDKLQDVRNQRDEIQTEFDDIEAERDEMEESRDAWMYDAELYKSERDDLSDELENLKSAVPQLAYAA